MRARKRLGAVLIALAFEAALSGCASRPAEHFYTVSDENAAPGTGAEVRRIALSPIVIPALIDRPQFVVRTSQHEIAVLESYRWAEPLAGDLTRALANRLRRSRPEFGIEPAHWQTGAPGKRLDVVITQLLSAPGANTWLEASWVLNDRQRNCIAQGRLEVAIPTAAGYGTVPHAYADAMSRLADAVARSIDQGISARDSSSVTNGSSSPTSSSQ